MEKSLNNKTMVKVGIYLCALLMMGAIAVASNIANIMLAFPDVSPTTIVAYLISVPSLIVIPTTIITGKLMDKVAKKTLMIVGIIFWLIGGVAPFFMGSLNSILAMRCIFGIGIGMVQSLCAALVVENFEDAEERDKTMGNVAAFQMLGTIIFSLVAGNIGKMGWHVAFLVHLVALVSLIGAIVCLPHKKPMAVSQNGEKIKFQSTLKMWIWSISFLIFMIGGQTYANTASFIITEMKLGDSVAAGYSLAIFALGGLVMGLVFGKVAKALGKMTFPFSCLLMSVAFLFIIFATNLPLSYIGAFFCGVSFSISIPAILNGSANSVLLSSSGMAVSVATCLQNIGMAICPYIVFATGASIAQSTSGSFSVNQGALISGIVILMALGIVFIIINAKVKDNS